jgi:Tfp pilus assembly protein PilE
MKSQRGVTLFGLMVWAVILGAGALLVMSVFPSVNEYYTVKKVVDKIAAEGLTTVPEIRAAFERAKTIEYAIQSISGKDLKITKENEKVVIAYAYDKEIKLVEPVFLLIKYEGRSK